MLQTGLRFRDFLEKLKEEHDLVEISEQFDPHLEVGALMRKAYEGYHPVPLFKNLKKDSRNPDPRNLFNIVGCIGGLRNPNKGNDHARIALHLGLDSRTPMNKIIDFLIEAKTKTPIPPQLVSNVKNAPCKENKILGNEINLNALPAPYLHDEDGGKYIQTYGMFILQTPDKSWTNWSIARAMITDDKHLTGLVISPQHIRKVADEWKKIGKGNEIPYALCFGVPPAAILVSSMPIPAGVSEADYIGSILGKPLEVVKAELSNLEVPVDSEIVLEGTLTLDKYNDEGPFGEMHGYVFPGTGHPCPIYEVKAMTYRNEAILPVSNPGLCTDETHTLIGGLEAAECKALALEHPILSKLVMDVFTPYESQVLWLAIRIDTKELIKLGTNSKDFCKLVAEFYFGRRKPAFIIHEIILVGEDIDIFNFRKLMWAYVTRHTPGDDQYFYDDTQAFPLAPFISQGPRGKSFKGGKCITDCLFPQQYHKNDFKFVTCDYDSYDASLRNKIEAKWKNIGFE